MANRSHAPKRHRITINNECPDPARWQSRIRANISIRDDGCWIWGGKPRPGGYGRFGFGKRGQMSAHRAAYLAFVGPIRPGFVIDHLCHVPPCVNPAHLEAVADRTNLARGYLHPVAYALNQEAHRATHCQRGHEFSDDNTGRDGDRRWCLQCGS